jgi:hypothetical protein
MDSAEAPVPPRPVSPLSGCHEKLLVAYRGWPSGRLGRSRARLLEAAMGIDCPDEWLRAELRLVGPALWELETGYPCLSVVSNCTCTDLLCRRWCLERRLCLSVARL